jgi:hypothetical protein
VLTNREDLGREQNRKIDSRCFELEVSSSIRDRQ